MRHHAVMLRNIGINFLSVKSTFMGTINFLITSPLKIYIGHPLVSATYVDFMPSKLLMTNHLWAIDRKKFVQLFFSHNVVQGIVSLDIFTIF